MPVKTDRNHMIQLPLRLFNHQPLFLKVWNLKIDFKNMRFESIPREENQEADRLVNEALDGKNKLTSLF